MRLKRALFASVGCALIAYEVSAEPNPANSWHYRAALDYLRAQGGDAFAGDPAQAIVLPEAVAADPLAAGPRSTSVLASLELASADARARRRRVLSALGLDANSDTLSLLDELCCNPDGTAIPGYRRPIPMAWLNDGLSESLTRNNGGFGSAESRVPNAVDRALAIQALQDSSPYVFWDRVADSIVFLLEYRIDGPTGVSWPLVRDGEAGGSGPVSDLGVTAEVVLALD